MKINIETTSQITLVGGVQCRAWDGVTEGGIRCKVFVHRVVIHKDQDASEFEKELLEQPASGSVVPLSDVLAELSPALCKQPGCPEPAAFRFTWPGQSESTICERHAPALKGVAGSLGIHLQLIRIADKAAKSAEA